MMAPRSPLVPQEQTVEKQSMDKQLAQKEISEAGHFPATDLVFRKSLDSKVSRRRVEIGLLCGLLCVASTAFGLGSGHITVPRMHSLCCVGQAPKPDRFGHVKLANMQTDPIAPRLCLTTDPVLG